MNQRSSASNKSTHRRGFLASAFAGGAVALWPGNTTANAKPVNSSNVCGNLSAADPLYIYQSLVWRLQPAAAKACRQTQIQIETDLSKKLEELWKLSDQLKARLFGQAKLKPAVEHMNALAYIGYTNALAVKAGLSPVSPEIARAHARSQAVITAEIVKASKPLSQQGAKTLDADEWQLLQEVLDLIEKIKTTYHPAFVKARSEFDECLSKINKTILAIESMLTSASTSVVRGQTSEALQLLSRAIKQLDDIPNVTVALDIAPEGLDASRSADAVDNLPEFLTREQFKMMLYPVKDLINGRQRLPRVSMNESEDFSLVPAVYGSPGEVSSVNTLVDPSSVRQIVKDCFVSGHWLQVVAVTAACLPLWSAYGRSEQRKVLIHSALGAIPRGRSKLWEAAYYLNNLT